MLADENPFKVGQDGGSEPFHPSIHFQCQLGPVESRWSAGAESGSEPSSGLECVVRRDPVDQEPLCKPVMEPQLLVRYQADGCFHGPDSDSSLDPVVCVASMAFFLSL